MTDPSALGRHLGLGDHIERFDHAALAVTDAATTLPFVETMGGSYVAGGHQILGGFRWLQFAVPGGLKLEVIAPLDRDDPDHFVNRFVTRRGPGLHHLTFKVRSLDEAVAALERRRYIVVGVSKQDPRWAEAFIHPSSTSGVLVQIAEFADDAGMVPPSLAEVLADPPP